MGNEYFCYDWKQLLVASPVDFCALEKVIKPRKAGYHLFDRKLVIHMNNGTATVKSV